MVGDGSWLSTGEVVESWRAAGWAESESTVRREIDDAIAAGYLRSYRTRGQYRRVMTVDVRDWIAAKQKPEGPQREAALAALRRRNRGDDSAPPGEPSEAQE